MMVEEQLGPKAREIFDRLEHHDHESGKLFPVILREHMDERGIADMEELHRLYPEAGGAMDLEEVCYNASDECKWISREFTVPLFRALGLNDRDAIAPLAVSIMDWSIRYPKRDLGEPPEA
jgi:hypothetical protein